MKAQSVLRSSAGALFLAAMLGACGTAQHAPAQVAPAPTTSVAQADQRLAAVAAERAGIEARFAAREQVCYARFFVNRCLDEAKERRRAALVAQRAIEVEAGRFKRQSTVDERDRALAQAEAEYKAEEARAEAEPAPAPRDTSAAQPAPRRTPAASRIARHNERVKEAQARARAEAPKRAANVEAYEKRKAESDQRQKVVAERKAEKAARAAKESQAAPAAKPGQ